MVVDGAPELSAANILPKIFQCIYAALYFWMKYPFKVQCIEAINVFSSCISWESNPWLYQLNNIK